MERPRRCCLVSLSGRQQVVQGDATLRACGSRDIPTEHIPDFGGGLIILRRCPTSPLPLRLRLLKAQRSRDLLVSATRGLELRHWRWRKDAGRVGANRPRRRRRSDWPLAAVSDRLPCHSRRHAAAGNSVARAIDQEGELAEVINGLRRHGGNIGERTGQHRDLRLALVLPIGRGLQVEAVHVARLQQLGQPLPRDQVLRGGSYQFFALGGLKRVLDMQLEVAIAQRQQ
mmetsp:Transcript_132249/g.382356  ORF Transcript_132249/g.382356 Transcript_132249/m.382356 type:complete len:229 (-) Transcript_132249:730-1416(-)